LAGTRLDDAQKVDGRGVEVLRLDVRDERLPDSVALDRRELHASILGHAVKAFRQCNWFSLRYEKTPKDTRAVTT
jgi:hypothetical protein